MAKKRLKKLGSFERFNNARAEKYELENRVTRRDLIPKEEIEEEWLKIVSHIRYGFEGLPSRMARALSGVSEPGEIYEIVDRDVKRVFESLANLGLSLESEADLLIEEDPKALLKEEDDEEAKEGNEDDGQENAEEKVEKDEPKKKPKKKAKGVRLKEPAEQADGENDGRDG